MKNVFEIVVDPCTITFLENIAHFPKSIIQLMIVIKKW